MTREDLINQRATTCRHGGHCEWVACDKCNHYEPDALSQQPCEDCIRREEALMALTGDVTDCTIEEYIARLREKLSKLPSVGKDINVTTNEDCISRQAVLDMLNNHKYSKEFCEEHHIDWSINLDTACIAINDLPSVTPTEKTGHWIIVDDCEKFIAKCSECGRTEDSRMISKYPYCHCGAKMIEPQESEISE